MTPVEVSLCGQAYTSTPSTTSTSLREPAGGLDARAGASSHGAAAAAANLAPNSPNVEVLGCGVSMRPKAAASQNAVEPPLPSSTS